MSASDSGELLDAAVTAALAGYAEVLEIGSPPPPALILSIYWDGDAVYQLAPPPVALPWDRLDWCVAHGRQDAAWEAYDPPEREGVELAMPELEDDPAMRALLAVLRDDDEGELLARYLELLASRLTRQCGVPVLVQGMDVGYGRPLDEQLRERLSAEAYAELEARDLAPRNRSADRILRDWDVLLHAALPDGGIAGIHRRDGSLLLASRLSMAMGSAGLGSAIDGPLHDQGGDPQVVGGLLPSGSTRVEVRDLFDEVHQAQVADGAWLCLLPHGSRGGEPPVRFLDESGACVLSLPLPAGAEPDAEEEEGWVSFGETGDEDTEELFAAFERDQRELARRLVRAATFEVAWPVQIPGTPELTQWTDLDEGPVTVLALGTDTTEVELGVTEYRDEVEPAARAVEAYEDALDATLPRREIARLAELAREGSIPGRWEGADVEFTSRSGADRWAAVAVVKRRRYVVIRGSGAPPERLDLEPVEL